MDHKSVLEEQVRELQKTQDININNGNIKETCLVSSTILEIIKELNAIS